MGPAWRAIAERLGSAALRGGASELRQPLADAVCLQALHLRLAPTSPSPPPVSAEAGEGRRGGAAAEAERMTRQVMAGTSAAVLGMPLPAPPAWPWAAGPSLASLLLPNFAPSRQQQQPGLAAADSIPLLLQLRRVARVCAPAHTGPAPRRRGGAEAARCGAARGLLLQVRGRCPTVRPLGRPDQPLIHSQPHAASGASGRKVDVQLCALRPSAAAAVDAPSCHPFFYQRLDRICPRRRNRVPRCRPADRGARPLSPGQVAREAARRAQALPAL